MSYGDVRLIRKTGVLEMAAAFQLVLEAEEDADLPVSYMQNVIYVMYLFREGRSFVMTNLPRSPQNS